MIRGTPVINVNNYVVGQTALTYQVPEIANTELNIDKAKSWSFQLDDIDESQSDLDLMNKFAADAGERLKVAIDTECFDYISTLAHADNQGDTAGAISNNINLGKATAPVSITSDNAVDLIVDLNAVLDEANISSENRWVVLPSWYVAQLKKGDLKSADITNDSTGLIRSGVIGVVDRTMIIQSNLLKHVTDTTECFYCMAGTKEAVTFAAQLTKTESLRIPERFGSYMRGLAVYGRAVVQPTALAMLYATKG